MVQHKHFKSLVRERMAKTGERYTAARAHVLASRPQPATEPGLLPGYPFPVGGADPAARSYDAALWQRVFAQTGVTSPASGAAFSEAMLAGLAGGIGFMVATFAYESITTATVVLRAHPEPYTERLLERSGVALDRTSTTSATAARTALDAALEAGRASVVRVTHGALPWIGSDLAEHQDSIDVAVVGRDGETLLVDGGDRSPGEEAVLHRVTPAELEAARAARKADRHWAASVTGEPAAVTEAQLADAVRAAVAETSGRLLGTLPLQGIPASWGSKFGVAGMRTWAGLLRDERTKQGWPALFADESRLRPGLQMVQSLMAGPRWGGQGGLRGLYAEFLTEASALPELAALERAAGIYRDLAPRWNAFVDAIEPDVAVADRAEHFAALAERLDELADLEEQVAQALAAALAR